MNHCNLTPALVLALRFHRSMTTQTYILLGDAADPSHHMGKAMAQAKGGAMPSSIVRSISQR